MPLTFMSGSYRQGGRPSSVLVKPTPTSTLFSLLGMAAAAKAAFAAMTVAAVAASAPPLSVLGIVDRYAPSDTTLLDNGAMAIEQDFAFYHHNTAHQQEGGGSTDPSSPTTTTMASFSEENAADGRRDTFFSPQWASPADAFGYYRRSSFQPLTRRLLPQRAEASSPESDSALSSTAIITPLLRWVLTALIRCRTQTASVLRTQMQPRRH